MMAKLALASIDPSRIDDAANTVRNELMPAFLAHPGAQQGYWMADRSTGRVLVMTGWADRETLLAAQGEDGTERTLIAERIGLRVRTVQVLDVLAAHDPSDERVPVLRWGRATWVEGVRPERVADLPELHRRVVPDQARSPGFCASYWLADQWTGNGLALSFWESAGALADGEPASRRRRRHLEQVLGCRVDEVREYHALGVAPAVVPAPVPTPV